jgi:hypothetical protein
MLVAAAAATIPLLRVCRISLSSCLKKKWEKPASDREKTSKAGCDAAERLVPARYEVSR